MPTVAHRFADYLNAFACLGLSLQKVREVVASEVSRDPKAKVMKRGPDAPLLVVFHLS